MKELFINCPDHVDLTKAEHERLLTMMADTIIEKQFSPDQISSVELSLLKDQDDKISEVFSLLVLKLAMSKMVVNAIQRPCHLSMVFAMYKEHNRIQRAKDHQHGEDFLRKKVAQLNWLCEANSNISWELIIVDDGCPENSGHIAQSIVDEEEWGEQVKVLFIQKAIERALPPVKNLSSANQSQKGGSIIYGMWHASQQDFNGDHIIAFTDADLSTHLGQTGLLMEPILQEKKLSAIGSRRDPHSIVVKRGGRNNRGKLFIYLWKRLIPILEDVVDTQCGFKAFQKETIADIIEGMIEAKFTFDIELLIKSEMKKHNSIQSVPIAWIDSEEASTTAELHPYLPMLQTIVKLYRYYLPSNPEADGFASLIESLEPADFNKMLDNIPSELLDREPSEFSDYKSVSVEQLRECLN